MKRQIEIFTVGCPICEPVVALAKETACENRETTIHNLSEPYENTKGIIKMKIKYILLVLLIIINVSFIISCSSSDSKSKKVIIVKESDIVKESIGVNGMTCVGCEVTLEESISKIEGVVSVKASHTDKEAIIEFDSTKTDISTITKTIKESGYKPFNK